MTEYIRAFRLYERDLFTKKIINHRDYIGLDKLQKYAPDTWKRYNQVYTLKYVRLAVDGYYKQCDPYQKTRGELSELINGKWVKLSDEEAKKLLNL